MNKKCFFTGHRDTPDAVKPLLEAAIEQHITEYGVTEFYVGTHGGFDSMATSMLAGMKQKYPFIHNYVVLAYHPTLRRPADLPTGFDCTIFPEDQETIPMRYAIPRLNRSMITNVEYLIAYVWKITDGSYKLMEAAESRERQGHLNITNLAKLPSDVHPI